MAPRPVRRALFTILAASGLVVPSATAGVVSGTITHASGWHRIATLAPGVSVQRETISVAGYRGLRTLTRIVWTLGDSHLSLGAGPAAPSSYDGGDESFGEAPISQYGRDLGALAGINGDTYCEWCGRNGDTLHGLLVRNRLIYAVGDGTNPEVGYTSGGTMLMASAEAVPVRVALPGGSAIVAVFNRRTLPSGSAIGSDQLAVFTSGTVDLGGGYEGLAVTGAAKVFSTLLRPAAPYDDPATKVVGSAGLKEWAVAYRVAARGGTAVTASLPAAGGVASSGSLVVPSGGAVLVARSGTAAATGLASAASAGHVSMPVSDAGWAAAASIMDGKFQMVAGGAARTAYPGWSDSWPWYCGGVSSGGCLRTAVATAGSKGWMIVVSGPWGEGLTMPDFARVLAQLGATNAMGFDANTHADLWRRGAAPIDSDGSYEPPVPAITSLRTR